MENSIIIKFQEFTNKCIDLTGIHSKPTINAKDIRRVFKKSLRAAFNEMMIELEVGYKNGEIVESQFNSFTNTSIFKTLHVLEKGIESKKYNKRGLHFILQWYSEETIGNH